MKFFYSGGRLSLADRDPMGRMKFTNVAWGALALLGSFGSAAAQEAAPPAPPAQSQQQSTSGAETPALKEVVVTGTLIRGVAPVGTDVVEVNADDIAATGATTIQDVLQTVPQMTNLFNQPPTIGSGSGGTGLTVIRPNIRNLAANGGNTTLVLLDGHNMVAAGTQTTADIGTIPPIAIERIEVVPDGGSSIYGSDAIGGIVNVVTRKAFSGLEIAAHGGYAEGYRKGDIGILAGRAWDSGSAMIAYDYQDNSDLLGRDRSYARQDLVAVGGSDFRSNACSPGNVTANGVNYALPNFTPGATNLCDQGALSDIYPEQHQHMLFARITQSFTDAISLDLSAYFTRRVITSLGPQLSATGATITSANPYFQSIAGATSEQVSFSYAGALGLGASGISGYNSLTEFGVTPLLTFKLRHDWEVDALTNLGESSNKGWTPAVNAAAQGAALAGTTTATALDPYDPAATNPAVLRSITNTYGQNNSNLPKLAEERVVAQGPVFSLPGGAVRLALGTQYHYESFHSQASNAARGDLNTGSIINAQVSRSATSAFGEAFVPLVGENNAMPGIRSLELDVSGRYDHYSDFGNTTNPKVGITYKPIEDLTIRGNVGTSFNAPSLLDEAGGSEVVVEPESPWQQSFSLANLFRPEWVLAGATPNLKPQTAHTFSVGGDYRPSYLRGVKLSLTYWYVNMKNVIAVVPFFQPQLFTNPGLARYFIINPTLGQATTFINGFVPPSQVIGGEGSIAADYALGAPYAILDAQRANVGTIKTDGLDFDGQYVIDTPIGTLSASLAGTLTLERLTTYNGGPVSDELQSAGVSPLQLAGTIGDTYGNLTARAMLTYSAGYPVTGIPNQTAVGSFHPVNLYFAYDLSGVGHDLNDTLVSLTIDNIADESPPFDNVDGGAGIPYGYANGVTLGRYFELGIQKKF